MTLADALISPIFKNENCIIHEGDDAYGMYFIEDGSVRVTITKDNTETQVSTVTMAKCLGEMTLVENKPRSASVYAIGKVKTVFFRNRTF